MKDLSGIIKQLSLIAQLGISLITPLLMCIFFAWFLNTKAGFGTWIYFLGFFFGLGSSAMTAYKVYLLQVKRDEKRDGKDKVYFNTHE